MRPNIFLQLSFLLLLTSNVFGQSVPVGSKALEDFYRRAQLSGKLDSTLSFTIRPTSPRKIGFNDPFYPDSTEKRYNLLNAEASFSDATGKIKGMLLPLEVLTQFNTHHPYGWNDGAMIPAKGFQTVLSAGVYAEYGPLSIQFRPEVVIAQNSDFEVFNKKHYDVVFALYYDLYNQIDAPARFGTSGYEKVRLGQSNIKLNFGDYAFGLSTENIWWGPGMRNSLLMSNNAPGFVHFTFNTTKPVSTPIGSFEGQLILGRLNGTNFDPLEPGTSYFGIPLHQPKRDDWRLLSGVVISYQPKWIPGLFLGLSRTAQTYHTDVSGFGDFVPLFSSVKNVSADEPIGKRDEKSSLFFRWLWPEEKAELYFELGQSNNSRSSRESALQKDRSRAYTFGVRKLFDLKPENQTQLLLAVEATQLRQTEVKDLLSTKSWYLHPYIRQGYTHQGEVLGAGIGPGADFQSVEASWVKGLKKIGLQIERYAHNNDFYYYTYTDTKDHRRHWVDISVGALGEWNYKNFIFSGLVRGVKSLNYQWYLEPPTPPIYWGAPTDAFNLQMQFGASYRF